MSTQSNRILDYGAIKSTGESIHESVLRSLKTFLVGTEFLCGHNIIHHDLRFLQESLGYGECSNLLSEKNVIDTLYWSTLLFPQRPYHRLVKDDKLQTEELNNPLNDAIKARDLFYDEVTAFQALPFTLKHIYYALLHGQTEFAAMFRFLPITGNQSVEELSILIREYFANRFCSNEVAHRCLTPDNENNSSKMVFIVI